jgi:tetratricopeptide (TPR) repeat protein
VAAACAAIASGRDQYLQLYPNLEGRLNRVGYDFLRRGLLVDALHAFHLNRELFPESWNVYDSYAEALLASGDREGSIANYRKSLELNPGHEAGQQRLAELVSQGR